MDAGRGKRAMLARMKRAVKIGLAIVGTLIVLAGAGGAGAHAWLKGRLTREAITVQMEKAWNCRADISEVKVALLSSPARLEILGCRLAQRDAEVAKPLARRALLPAEKVEISVSRMVLEIRLQDLASRRLNVQQLLLSGVNVQEDVTREGDSSLAVLFSKPEPEAGAPAPEAAAPAPPTVAAAAPAPAPPATAAAPAPAPAPTVAGGTPPVPPAPPGATASASTPPPAAAAGEKSAEPASGTPEAGVEKKKFGASELGFSINVQRARLEQGEFHRADHKALTKTDVSGLAFTVSDIDVNPADLANHNSVKLAIEGRWKQRGRIGPKDNRREVTMADLALTGEGTMHPFDPATGLWSPANELTLTARKDSILGGYMTLGEAAEKELKKAESYGLDLRSLPVGGALLEDARLHIRFEQDRITLLDDARFQMPEFELALKQESWLNAAEDAHQMQVRLIAGPTLQEQLGGSIKKLLGEETGATVVKSLANEQGRVTLDLDSTGRLSKPKVVPDLQRLLNQMLKGFGGGLLDGLLKK